MLRKAIRLNPYYPPYVHCGLWGDSFRREEYEQAYVESLNFRMTGNFWEPLAQAAALGHLGRMEEGKKAADTLLNLKPDFPSRGRVLIGYFTKFEDISERMVEGLHEVGLDIE